MMSGNLQLMVRSLGALLAVMVAVILLPTVSSGSEGLLFGKVFVSQAKIDSSFLTQERHNVPSGMNQNLVCSSICETHEWSKLWCWDPSSEECIFSDAIVNRGYQETNMDDAITCYTKGIRDMVTSAVNIFAGGQYISSPQRVKGNLIDGFYNYDIEECFRAQLTSTKDHWFKIDFGSPKTFRKVLVKAGNANVAHNFGDFEVRVGTIDVPLSWNGLDGHDVFGSFSGTATPNQEIVFESTEPVTARYVSVRKMGGSYFQPCHIEIY